MTNLVIIADLSLNFKWKAPGAIFAPGAVTSRKSTALLARPLPNLLVRETKLTLQRVHSGRGRIMAAGLAYGTANDSISEENADGDAWTPSMGDRAVNRLAADALHSQLLQDLLRR